MVAAASTTIVSSAHVPHPQSTTPSSFTSALLYPEAADWWPVVIPFHHLFMQRQENPSDFFRSTVSAKHMMHLFGQILDFLCNSSIGSSTGSSSSRNSSSTYITIIITIIINIISLRLVVVVVVVLVVVIVVVVVVVVVVLVVVVVVVVVLIVKLAAAIVIVVVVTKHPSTDLLRAYKIKQKHVATGE